MRATALFICISILLAFAFPARSQSVPIWKIADLKREMAKQDDTTRIFNFFATWCKPCMEEMPDLLASKAATKGNKVRFWFVSLDFKKDLIRKVEPFAAKSALHGAIALLDEPDYNSWLPSINKNWEGNIPATLFVFPSGDKSKFLARQLKANEIEKILAKQLTTTKPE